ncbi:hypothetical protein NPX13_g4723 [Xylaria arbuscula]|uniref:Uncharacterized protein n=1 Tax=Xylaria arbuscula TaxID=114810 RepID=A0A9W8TN19_9PEZI|nr:hypothetical protein NPX13_g4723 [Xylaria arbuscula]
MGLTDGLLGPLLGGILGFLGAIVAAIIAFALARRKRAEQVDEEYTNPQIPGNHELGPILNYNRLHHQGLINGMDHIHHGQYRSIEFYRALEVNVARL